MLERQALGLVVVNRFRFLGHAISNELVSLPRKIQRMPVGQVPAMSEVHSQHGIARL